MFWLKVLLVSLAPTIQWHYNLPEAEQLATANKRCILLNFSGSDWCGPCIRLHKEVFASEEFSKYADTSLVMLNADFPRMGKNQLPAKQQAINDALADKYNAKGIFPFTLLLSADGKVIKTWEGFPQEPISDFITDIQAAADASRHN